MDGEPKTGPSHGEHIRVQRMSCRVLEGFNFVRRVVDRKEIGTIANRALAIKSARRPFAAAHQAHATAGVRLSENVWLLREQPSAAKVRRGTRRGFP